MQETNLGGGAEPPRLSGWQLVGRRDRRINRDGQVTSTHHGGVAFLVREGVHYEDKPDVATSAVAPNDDTTECSAIKIHDPRLAKPVTILNVYVPPVRAIDGRDQCFDPNFLPTTPDTFVLGDFNAHSPTWDPNAPEDHAGEELDDWAILGEFVVLNDGSPTRVSSRGIATAPDVSFVPASWEQHLTWQTSHPIGSDHLPIIIEVRGGTHTKQSRRKATFSYKKANWQVFQDSLDSSLSEWDTRPPTNVHRANAALSSAIALAAKKAIPKGSRKTQCAWWCPEVEQAVTRRRRAQEDLQAHPDDDDKAETFQLASHEAQDTIDEAKARLWHEFVTDSRGELSSAEIWSVIRAIDGRTPPAQSSSVISSDDGKMASTNSTKANLFCKEYAKVSRLPKDKAADKHITLEARRAVSSPCSCTTSKEEYHPCSPFTNGELSSAVNKLPFRSSAGPDEISNTMLRNLSALGQRCLLHTANLSWLSGEVPSSWRIAEIRPIPKPGKPPNTTSSFRPISLLSCIGKVVERLIHERLVHFLEVNNLLHPAQAGFRRNRSTEEQVAAVTQLIHDGFQQRRPPQRTALLLADFSRAYDRVWRKALLVKMARKGIPGCYIRWVRGFLSDRKAFVSWQGATSRKRTFSEGLPQGSVLAPLLWLIYMDDLLDSNPQCSLVFAFADDTTFAAQGSTLLECETALQPAADLLYSWCSIWKVSLSTTKSVVSFFTLDPRETNGKAQPTIYFGPEKVPFEGTPRLLGVTLDCQLTFGPHVDELKKKVSGRLKVLRCLAGRSWGRSPSSLRSLYCAYAQSCTLYCASSWLVSTATNHLRKLESQHLAGARIITGCTRSTPAVPLLKEAGLLPLATHANLAAASLRERALRHTQETPIAAAAARSVEPRIRRHGAGGATRKSWRDSATDIAEHLGLDDSLRESFALGLPPWCGFRGVTFDQDLGSLTGSSDVLDPVARLAIATSALARLPPVDIELWTDGSAPPGVGAGAGFAIYIHGLLYSTEAHPAGRESSDFRAEAVAINMGLAAIHTIQDLQSYASIRVLSDCQSLISTLSGGPARQTDSVCNFIWSQLSTISTNFNIHIQWIPSHIGLPGNTLADSEAKRGSCLSQSSVPIDLASAKVQIRRTGQQGFHTRYLADPHSATHRTFTGEVNPQFHWRLGWYRSECITVAQLRTGHSPLLASYLHRIGQQQSPLCPYCGGDDETAQHLLLCCPTHMQARTSTNYIDSTDPRRMMSFLETIGAVTRPPDRE